MKLSFKPRQTVAVGAVATVFLLVANVAFFLNRGIEDSYYPTTYSTIYYPTDRPVILEWQEIEGGIAVPWIKLYRRVAGAELVVETGMPGTEVSVVTQVAAPAGDYAFPWPQTTVADDLGIARLRVPYPTTPPGAHIVAGELMVGEARISSTVAARRWSSSPRGSTASRGAGAGASGTRRASSRRSSPGSCACSANRSPPRSGGRSAPV